MKRAVLENILEKENVSRFDYGFSVDGKPYCEGIVFNEDSKTGKYSVAYKERYENDEIGIFGDEESACELMLNELSDFYPQLKKYMG